MIFWCLDCKELNAKYKQNKTKKKKKKKKTTKKNNKKKQQKKQQQQKTVLLANYPLRGLPTTMG